MIDIDETVNNLYNLWVSSDREAVLETLGALVVNQRSEAILVCVLFYELLDTFNKGLFRGLVEGRLK